MKKRCGAIFLAVCLVCTLMVFPVGARAESGAQTGYYRAQLTPAQEIFYGAMQELYTSGALKTGTGSADLTARLSQAELKAYAEAGNPALAQAFQAARDAFAQDVCDIFYVDTTKLTLRVGTKGGQYVAYLNNGANASYYKSSFTSLAQVDAALAAAQGAKQAIASEIRQALALPAGDVSAYAGEIVEKLHDALLARIQFSYPSAAQPDVAGVYGALVGGFANCEGYSRAFKWIMDDFGIPCVLVSGIGENSRGINEEHMWNYVQIGEHWYAVDLTWDDPVGGEPRSNYLLRCASVMEANHYPYGAFSPSGKEFTYPALSDIDYSVRREELDNAVFSDSANGLSVQTQSKVDTAGDAYTVYSISYNGKDLPTAETEGKFFAMRVMYPQAAVDTVRAAQAADASGEAALDIGPWYGMNDLSLPYNGAVSLMDIHRKCYVQFCVTEIAPDSGNLNEYKVDLSLPQYNVALTKPVFTPAYSNYVAPPFVHMSDPVLTRTILPEKQHYTVQYDERLTLADPALPIGITVECTEPHIAYTVENVTLRDSTYTIWDGTAFEASTVEFDFTPDTSFQGYLNTYRLQPANVVGAKSGKVPNSFPVITTYPMSIPCPCVVGNGGVADAFVIGLPTLVVNEAMDIFEYDSPESGNALDIRLIASIPDAAQENALLGSLGASNLAGNIKSSATYDLALSCKGYAARLKSDTNYNVTIGLPYPPGFNYNDNQNVEFKAYHYRKVGDSYVPEELVCQITPQGLVVIAKNFSPFTIVATEKGTAPSASTYKTVNVASKTGGGTVTTPVNGTSIGASGLYATLADAPEKSFSIQAESGYVIDRILLDGNVVSLPADATSYACTLRYDTMQKDSTLQVYFIAKSVQTAEKSAGFTPVLPKLVPEGITPPPPSSSTPENPAPNPQPAPAPAPVASVKNPVRRVNGKPAAQSKSDSMSESSSSDSGAVSSTAASSGTASSDGEVSSASTSPEQKTGNRSFVIVPIILGLVVAISAAVGVILYRKRY